MPLPVRGWLLPLGGGLAAGSVAGLFGIGGGILLVPVLVLLLHRDQHVAHATSLLAITVPAAAGAARFGFAGAVDWSGAALVALGSLVGVQVGARLLTKVSGSRLRTLFAALLVLMALRLLIFGADGGDGVTGAPAITTTAGVGLVVLGVAVGALSALLGIGGGAVIVPALVIAFGFGQHTAEGTSLAVILPTALLGAVTHARSGLTDWRVGWQLGTGGLVGALLGAELALALPGPVLARAFAVLLLVVAGLLLRGPGEATATTDVEAEMRSGAPVTVLPLTADRADDLLGFFDHRAQPDGHRWSGCYCAYDRFPGPDDEFDPADGANNRALLRRALDADRVRGWLAYDGDEVVGWLHATSRLELPHLKVDAPPPGRHERVGVLACFTIAPSHRRTGVASALLEAALDAFDRQGFDVVEGYPPRAPRSEDSLYRGSVSLYERAGFTVTAELEHHLVMRRRR